MAPSSLFYEAIFQRSNHQGALTSRKSSKEWWTLLEWVRYWVSFSLILDDIIFTLNL
jgi:hypothetical protein